MKHTRQFVRELQDGMPELELRENELLAPYTTFRIGGPAALAAFPATQQELAVLLAQAGRWQIPTWVLGGGSNVLVPDEGLDGLVILLRRLNGIRCSGERELAAECGASLAKVAHYAAQCGLTGLEFAQGIPGTVGGGVYMNAGAYGGELSQVVVRTQALDAAGQLKTCCGQAHEFGHRQSVYMREPATIVSAVFRLQPGEPGEIRARMEELAARRRASQPLELPSAGSAFKRPQGGYAAALIDAAGLKGLRIGDAAVSEKHAGFIVNLCHATASDVRRLIAEIQRRVLEHSGISLEPEIRILTGGAKNK